MTKKTEPTERVAQQWPVSLKERVREEVGQRGMTKFTLEAVRAKLGDDSETVATGRQIRELTRDLDYARDLAQRLADSVACGGDYVDRRERLQEIGLPSWINTQGWPEDAAALVKPEVLAASAPDFDDSDFAPNENPDTDSGLSMDDDDQAAEAAEVDEDLHRPMFMTGRNLPTGGPMKIEPMETEPVAATEIPQEAIEELATRPTDEVEIDNGVDLPHDRQTATRSDLFAKLQQEGRDLGIDLKPASEVLKPEPKKDAPPTPNEPVAEPAEPEMAPVTNPDACPKCGSELVNGECWECF